jgi:hypothetical protein
MHLSAVYRLQVSDIDIVFMDILYPNIVFYCLFSLALPVKVDVSTDRPGTYKTPEHQIKKRHIYL